MSSVQVVSSGQESLFPASARARKQPSGPQAECVRFWETEWLKTRGYAWKWTAKHAALLAQAFRLAGSVEEVTRRCRNLLGTQDQFLKRAACPGLLVSQWNHPLVAKRAYEPKPAQSASQPGEPRSSAGPNSEGRPSPSAAASGASATKRAELPPDFGRRIAAAIASGKPIDSVLSEMHLQAAASSCGTSPAA